ncbi:Protein of unknown function [Filimonas lacunae]|uniref:Uncharacterized protein n=1 Tax=Filimonas lacunae TaxID=477680 RepID=A0A173MGF7_9BACT|nr:DUF1810 family protein [Filimonas lacunae]BAV06712.1 hypothetical protein FLA_2732 [Filimonas lacunae]SIT34475.1 Protein of unknown function [Filimonas lacunae]
MAQRYDISDLGEAVDYLAHPALRKRLMKISQALLELPSNNTTEIMGRSGDIKLQFIYDIIFIGSRC